MECRSAQSIREQIETATGADILRLTETEYGSLDPQKLDHVRSLLLDRADEPGPPYLIVDLSAVQFFGAGFIGTLVDAWDRLRKRGRQLIVCGLTPLCGKLILTLHLDKLFTVYPTPKIALQATGQGVPDLAEAAPNPGIRVRKSDVAWDPRLLRLEYLGEDNVPFRSIIVPRNTMTGHQTPECGP